MPGTYEKEGMLILSGLGGPERTSSGHAPITDIIKMNCLLGTSDRPCWLAKACKILLLLLLGHDTLIWSAVSCQD